jgi:CHAD domain-containing protein
MAFRLVPGQPVGRSVRQIGIEQIDRVLPKFSGRSKDANAVHETRKALKRLRALLNLVKPALPKRDYQRRQARLKRIARSLSGVRDHQILPEAAKKLASYHPALAGDAFAASLTAKLEARRKAAERRFDGGSLLRVQKLLEAARQDFAGLELQEDGFDIVVATLERDYARGRRGCRHAYDAETDDAFHDWRKYVQRHWRQLLLVAPGWPKAIRPQIALARDLAEALGEDHDIALLAAFVAEHAEKLGDKAEAEAYLELCRRRQAELRLKARPMGERLFAEKPSSLAARLKAYWETAPRLAAEEDDTRDESSNVIALKL